MEPYFAYFIYDTTILLYNPIYLLHTNYVQKTKATQALANAAALHTHTKKEIA